MSAPTSGVSGTGMRSGPRSRGDESGLDFITSQVLNTSIFSEAVIAPQHVILLLEGTTFTKGNDVCGCPNHQPRFKIFARFNHEAVYHFSPS